jgi:hypothetical protein
VASSGPSWWNGIYRSGEILYKKEGLPDSMKCAVKLTVPDNLDEELGLSRLSMSSQTGFKYLVALVCSINSFLPLRFLTTSLAWREKDADLSVGFLERTALGDHLRDGVFRSHEGKPLHVVCVDPLEGDGLLDMGTNHTNIRNSGATLPFKFRVELYSPQPNGLWIKHELTYLRLAVTVAVVSVRQLVIAECDCPKRVSSKGGMSSE